MNVLEFFAGFLPLGVVGVAIAAAVHLAGRRGRSETGDPSDPSASIRRLFVFGLLFVTMLLTAEGMVSLGHELLAADTSNDDLARALAVLIVGGPSFAALFVFVDRRLDRGPEVGSLAWVIFVNVVLLVTMLVAMLEAHDVVQTLLDPDDHRLLDGSALLATVVWGGSWGLHRFVLGRGGRITGDLHLAVGTVVGLVTLGAGLAGLFYVGADEIYTIVFDDPLSERAGPTTAGWLATTTVGAVVWSWHWLRTYRKGHRSELWYLAVVPIGALVGFVALVATAAIASNAVAVWYLGDPFADQAVRHFDLLPVTFGIGLAGLLSWQYHRLELGADPQRGDARRSYDYLLSAAALLTSVIGAVLALSVLFSSGPNERNTALAGATMLVVGAPLWVRFWLRLGRAVASDRAGELRSPLRRIHLFTIFGSGALAGLIALVAVLNTSLEDILDGTLSRTTLHDNRFSLAVLLTVTGLTWYHFRVYLAERDEYSPRPPPPPPPALRHPKRVIVLASDHDELAGALAASTGATVTRWHRTDREPDGDVDPDRLGERIAARTEEDVLVVIGDDEPTIIPFEVTRP